MFLLINPRIYLPFEAAIPHCSETLISTLIVIPKSFSITLVPSTGMICGCAGDEVYVRVTKSMCGADCWSDHRLIVTKLNVRVQPKRCQQCKKAPNRLNITQLKNTNIKECFAVILEVRLESTPLDSQNVEADWATLREMVYNTATEILGPSTRKHKDWFDENCDEIK